MITPQELESILLNGYKGNLYLDTINGYIDIEKSSTNILMINAENLEKGLFEDKIGMINFLVGTALKLRLDVTYYQQLPFHKRWGIAICAYLPNSLECVRNCIINLMKV